MSAMSGHGDPLEVVARALEGSLLDNFEIRRKIGGKDISPGGLAQTVTMHGVCSYVYDVVCRLPAPEVSGQAFALKVMINMQGEQTMDLQDAYRAEYEILADTQKLPRHPNITCVLRHFNDLATQERLPGFDFDPQDVSATIRYFESRTQLRLTYKTPSRACALGLSRQHCRSSARGRASRGGKRRRLFSLLYCGTSPHLTYTGAFDDNR